jgi:multicomponent Na+:H+ antiporter subunit A
VFVGQINELVVPAAVELDGKADVYELHRWPGLTAGLAISLVVIVTGIVLGVVVARRTVAVPKPLGADSADRLLDAIPIVSRTIIGRVQHGSLPIYLATMATVVSLAALSMALRVSPDRIVVWDEPVQALLVAVIVAVAVAGVFVRSRLGAALTLGAVGICVSGVYILHGAPDLALTQLLVETVVVVGFVLGLGHLARRFPESPGAWRRIRMVVSLAVGVGVAGALAVAGSQPVGRPPIGELARAAIDEGGGENVVNVILTDIRGLDTLGEITVLVIVSIGIGALANVRRSEVTT